MTERIYRYREFDVLLDVESVAQLNIGITLRLPVNHMCNIRMHNALRHRELPPIHLIGEQGHPFDTVADAIFAGRRAAEDAIDKACAAFASEDETCLPRDGKDRVI